MVNLESFWKTDACGQTVLPDRSILIGQKLVENAKNSNATFWVIFKQCDLVHVQYYISYIFIWGLEVSEVSLEIQYILKCKVLKF